MTHREKLTEAARLLDEVRAELNVNAQVCQCCGLTKKENWSEAQLAESLRAVAAKIRRLMELGPV